MAAERKRAPRVAREGTNMAATAAGLRGPSVDAADFAASWLAVWQAYGGTVSESAVPMIGFQVHDEPIATAVGLVPIVASTVSERTGALSALAAMLRIAGRPAMDAVLLLSLQAGRA